MIGCVLVCPLCIPKPCPDPCRIVFVFQRKRCWWESYSYISDCSSRDHRGFVISSLEGNWGGFLGFTPRPGAYFPIKYLVRNK